MKQDEDDFLLSRREVEERFGLSKRFLELAGLKGQGPRIVRLGRAVRYRVSDVRDWIAKQAEELS